MIRAALALSVSLALPAASVAAFQSAGEPTRAAAAVAAGDLAFAAAPVAPPPPVAPGPDLVGTAIELAHSTGSVLASDEGEECARADLLVSWDVPGETYLHGAYVEPLGPAPTAGTTEVNGVVLCATSPYSFMGFEAALTDGGWDIVPVPYLWPEDGEGEHAHDDDGEHGDDDAPAPVPTGPVDPPAGKNGGAAIEGYAAYEPQRSCDPSPKSGTLSLRSLLLGSYGGRSMGISRACRIGGRSEHKEGRALDWGMNVRRPQERAAAEAFLSQLLATDAYGNRHAVARRMGVMYVIWNGRIWSAYRPSAGWRSYSGRSPHTDHVHVSLSWAGALGRTSFWSGDVADGGTFLAIPAGLTAGTSSSPRPAPTGDRGDAGTVGTKTDGEKRNRDRRVTERAEHDAAFREELERLREERRLERERLRQERRAERERLREELRAQREVAREEHGAERERLREELRAQQEAEKEIRRAQYEAEKEARRAERRAQREAEREARRAERAAEKEARRQDREARRAERRAQHEAEKESRQAEREAQKEARRAERKAENEARQAEREAQKEARRAERKAENEARRAERAAEKEARRQEREARKQAEREAREARREAKHREREERQSQHESEHDDD